MKTSKINNSYIVFFTNLPDIDSSRRTVRIRQLVTDGLGTDIEIVENIVFPIKFIYSGILILKSKSIEIIEKALKPAEEEFHVEIQKIEDHTIFDSVDDYTHCLFFSNPEQSNIKAHETLNASDSLSKIHSSIKYSGENPMNSILLVNTEDYFDALKHCENTYLESNPLIRWTESFSEFLENSANYAASNDETAEELPQSEATLDDNLGQVHNEGTATAYISYSDRNNNDLRSIFGARRPALSSGYNKVQEDVCFWETMEGHFEYYINYRTNYSIQGGQVYEKKILPVNAPIPQFIKTVGSKGFLSFNLPSTDTFHFDTKVGTWLNELYNTTIYDLPWPEDEYKGEKLAAYKNIISQLVANGITTVPKDGTITTEKLKKNAHYQEGSGINKEAFTKVMSHLSDECDNFFSYSQHWFGGSGLFHSLIMEVNSVAQNDLTAVANRMTIPPKTSEIKLILNSIFSEIISIVSAIPGEGPALAAIISLGWNTAKLSMAPGKSSAPIQVAIANMADELNTYLENMIGSNATHLGIINGNWGKLKEFTSGAINKVKINEQMFGMASAVNNPAAPAAYIKGIADAWKVICYKGLFPGHFDVNASINITKDLPKPRFNRSKANNVYSYYLKCEAVDSCGKKYPAYAEMIYENKAPQQALDELFKPDQLNLNPIEFYLGYNGWKREIPKYNEGMRDVHNSLYYPWIPLKWVKL